MNIHSFARCVGIALLEKGFSVSPLKLQKILYYQQAWHLVFFSKNEQDLKPLFSEKPQAWINGPVYPSIFAEYRNSVNGMCEHMGYQHFDVNEENANTELRRLLNEGLNEDEQNLFNQVIDLYGSLHQSKLVLMTHSEDPWIIHRGDLGPLERSTAEITFESMYKFYKNRYDKNHSRQ